MEELRIYMDRQEVNILMIQEPYARYDISWPGCRMYYGANIHEDIWTLTVVLCPDLKVVMHAGSSCSAYTVIEVKHETFKCMLVNA